MYGVSVAALPAPPSVLFLTHVFCRDLFISSLPLLSLRWFLLVFAHLCYFIIVHFPPPPLLFRPWLHLFESLCSSSFFLPPPSNIKHVICLFSFVFSSALCRFLFCFLILCLSLPLVLYTSTGTSWDWSAFGLAWPISHAVSLEWDVSSLQMNLLIN